MWIKAATFERLMKERYEATGVNIALERMATAQKATIEFMAMRLQQVEHERALLTEKFLGISLPVPVVKNMPSLASTITADDLLNSMPSFEDMGDDAAAAEGVSWDETGRIVYAKKA
jgi:hypothetical protein